MGAILCRYGYIKTDNRQLVSRRIKDGMGNSVVPVCSQSIA